MGGGVKVIKPNDIAAITYDYIVVASRSYQEIENKLMQMGISAQKIHQVYDREKYMYDEVIRQITHWNFTCSNHEYEIGNYRIDLGHGHKLPRFQMNFPMYDYFLGELSRYLQDDKWAVDIGANVGDSVFLLKKHSNIQILAVEPVSDFYDLLCKNVEQITNVLTEKCIVALDEDKEYRLEKDVSTACTREADGNVENNHRKLTIQHLTQMKGIRTEQIQLLKIDTDGFDADCILSLGTMINRLTAFIYFESYIINRDVLDRYAEAYDFLNKNGYCSFFVFDNFGNFLCEGDAEMLKTINQYLLRGKKGNAKRTIDYFDVLAVKAEQYGDAKRAVKEYVAIFDADESIPL